MLGYEPQRERFSKLSQERLSRLSQSSKEKSLEEKVQKKYLEYFGRYGDMDRFELLQRMTGIEPSDDVVQEAYARRFEEMPHNISYSGILSREQLATEELKELKLLQRMTGIKPSDDVVQEAYAHHAFYGVMNFEPEMFGLLLRFTGIKPSDDIVQEAYARLLIEENDLKYFLKLERMHRFDILGSTSVKFDEFKLLRDATGIKPSDDVVQKAYTGYLEIALSCRGIRHTFMDHFEELHKETKIRPSKSVSELLVKCMIKN